LSGHKEVEKAEAERSGVSPAMSYITGLTNSR
jgi:hypothetical protein